MRIFIGVAWRRHRDRNEENVRQCDSEVIVFLIHGTWAVNAKWTREGSVIRRALKESLSIGSSISFVNFYWSGRNTMSGRKDAIKTLNADLKKSIVLSPKSKHVLVSHSHAGNVALRSISDDLKIK